MRALDKKLVRDLWSMRGQVVAISAIVACGIATLVALASVYDSIRLTRAAYYGTYRFGDVFASLTRAPEGLAARVAEIPGVAAVQTRVVVPVTLDLPGRIDAVTGRIVSIPDGRAARVNAVFVRRGRTPAPYTGGDVLASEAFADANGLRVGDTLGVVVNGRWQRLRIVGIALSPEYVYEVGPGELWPDDRRFGVLWMGRRALATAYDMTGAFNDVSLRLSPDAGVADVVSHLDHVLEAYGGAGAFGRHDQISDFVTSSKIQQLRSMAVIIPTVFLGVATFLAYLLLARFVRTDRMQIGTLKAFGYSGGRIAQHYLLLALVVVLIGGVFGAAAGTWLGNLLMRAYAPYFHFPFPVYRVSPTLVATAFIVTTAAGLLGAFGSVRAAAALPPAAAMQPEAPPNYRPAMVDRLGINSRLPLALRMILRNIERRPATPGVTVLGVALATGLLVVGQGMFDGTTRMLSIQFDAIERDDVTLTFDEVRAWRALLDVRHLPGVIRAEPFRSVAARLRAGQRSYRIAIMGMRQDDDLRGIFDAQGRRIALPAGGILLSATVAGLLRVAAGDSLEVEALQGRRQRFRARIGALVEQPIGVAATMQLDELDRSLGEEGTISGARLLVDSLALVRLDSILKRTPALAGVSYRSAAIENARHTFSDSVAYLVGVLLLFSVTMTVGVVYNAARIALSERGRELATLRILGFSNREIATMLLGEHALLTVLGIPLGIVLGYALLFALSRSAFNTELFRLPFVVVPSTCAVSAVAVALVAVGSGAVVRRRLAGLDLVGVLKGE
jgi:putative ABC transport system permease protein